MFMWIYAGLHLSNTYIVLFCSCSCAVGLFSP